MNAAPLDDVAKEFGISRETLYRLIRRNRVRTYKQIGDRRTYVDRDDIRPLVGLQPKDLPATGNAHGDG